MSIPLHVDDGDFSVPEQNGDWDYEYPFVARGETFPYTFIATRKMRASSSAFVLPPLMTQRNFPNQPAGTAYFVDVEKPKSIGQGMIEWGEVYASLPKRRVEVEPVVFAQAIRLPGQKLLQLTERTQADIVYEYALNEPLPTILKTFTVEGVAGIYTYGNINIQDPNTPDVPVIASDAMSTIWMGRIFERRTEYVRNKKLQLSPSP